jgi:hypothetical protein
VGPSGGSAAVSIASAVVRAIFAGSLTVIADLTSGLTKGRWSIS